MSKKSWNLRGLTSLLTLSGFVVMSITGIILYIVPAGRVAYWIDWELLMLTKTQWGDIHILSSLFFVVAGFFHIYFNWRPLLNYFRHKATKTVSLKKELAVTLVATILITIGGIAPFPPLGYLLDFNGWIKDLWIEDNDYEPPFGHAEDVSLASFCKKVDIDLPKALEALKAAGIKGVSKKRKLKEIALDNGMNSLNIYQHIKHLEADARPEGQKLPETIDEVEEMFAGKGIGNKTVSDIAKALKVSPTVLITRLKKANIEIKGSESIKQAATRLGITPLDILKKALVKSSK